MINAELLEMVEDFVEEVVDTTLQKQPNPYASMLRMSELIVRAYAVIAKARGGQ